VLYGISVAVGLYSQPLTCFPVLAQVLCAPAPRRYVLPAAGAAALSFLPWYALQYQAQAQYAVIYKPLAFFSFRQIMPQILLHDLTGGGYACTIALLLLAMWALLPRAYEFPRKPLLIYSVAIALVGPIIMDVIFNYFFAERQLLLAMPALILLGCQGFERSRQEGRATVGCVLLAVYFVSAGVRDFRLATVAKDDLARTSDAIATQLPSDSCILAAPRERVEFYVFLRPELEQRVCPKEPESPEILTVIGSYTTPAERKALSDAVSPRYEQERTVTIGQSELTVYRRR
jgi:hypothetical protein